MNLAFISELIIDGCYGRRRRYGNGGDLKRIQLKWMREEQVRLCLVLQQQT